MSAAPDQQVRLDLLDWLALVQEVDADVRTTATRIANRARTNDEADDVRLLIACRGRLARLKQQISSYHPDRLGGAGVCEGCSTH